MVLDSRVKATVVVQRNYDKQSRVVSEIFSSEGVTCPDCRGSGKLQLLTTISTCGACSGRGKVGGSDLHYTFYYPEVGLRNETKCSDDPQK
jgi:RecJ-like exonuclease